MHDIRRLLHLSPVFLVKSRPSIRYALTLMSWPGDEDDVAAWRGPPSDGGQGALGDTGGSRDLEEGTPAEDPADDDAVRAMLGAQEYHQVPPLKPLQG